MPELCSVLIEQVHTRCVHFKGMCCSYPRSHTRTSPVYPISQFESAFKQPIELIAFRSRLPAMAAPRIRLSASAFATVFHPAKSHFICLNLISLWYGSHSCKTFLIVSPGLFLLPLTRRKWEDFQGRLDKKRASCFDTTDKRTESTSRSCTESWTCSGRLSVRTVNPLRFFKH